MLGAILGDIIGSPYEYHNIRSQEFPLFSDDSRYTDDTVLTVATAYALLHGTGYKEAYEQFARLEPDQDYGASFRNYVFRQGGLQPYNSLGNGSAMRVSPVGWFFDSPEATHAEAAKSAECSHNHPEGIRGAQCTALLIYHARMGVEKVAMNECAREYGFAVEDAEAILAAPRGLDETCKGTVPVAIAAFLVGDSWESCVRAAVSAGGDTDTIACITGAIAEAYYGGVPTGILRQGLSYLPPSLSETVEAFRQRCNVER